MIKNLENALIILCTPTNLSLSIQKTAYINTSTMHNTILLIPIFLTIGFCLIFSNSLPPNYILFTNTTLLSYSSAFMPPRPLPQTTFILTLLCKYCFAKLLSASAFGISHMAQDYVPVNFPCHNRKISL